MQRLLFWKVLLGVVVAESWVKSEEWGHTKALQRCFLLLFLFFSELFNSRSHCAGYQVVYNEVGLLRENKVRYNIDEKVLVDFCGSHIDLVELDNCEENYLDEELHVFYRFVHHSHVVLVRLTLLSLQVVRHTVIKVVLELVDNRAQRMAV